MNIRKAIKNTALVSGGLPAFRSNLPSQYGDKQHEYLSAETKVFTEVRARYSNDFILAQVQGIDPSAPLEWGQYYIRMADVVNPSASITRRFDNYKAVLFADRTVQYIRPGTKIVAMGNTWLCTNPINISGGDGAGIVQRCNATWNHLDYYGNLLKEPIVKENARANASESDAQSSMYITKGYFNIVCQYNEETAQIDTNTRMILGKGAYRVTGYNDVDEEFTGDEDSIRLLEFSIRYIEPNAAIDDMANHVAGGKAFSWVIQVAGTANATVGDTAQFSASSTRNGEDVVSTTEHPISYVWSSSDESVATVDENGLVTCVGAGEVEIIAALSQNESVSTSFTLTIEEPGTETGVKFTSTVPTTIYAYEDAEITAAYFNNGIETDEEITFTFSGADSSSYGVITGPKGFTIYCYGYSKEALVVTASKDENSVSAEIQLAGM